MSIRRTVRCDPPRYFTALCPICEQVHVHRVVCRKRNECPSCNQDAREELRDGYGPLIDEVFRAKSHRVFAVTATHASSDPRVRLCLAFGKLACSGLIASDFDDQFLPFYRFVLVFDDDPGLLEVKLRAARCAYFVKEASSLSEIDRALNDLIPLRDRLTAHLLAEQHPRHAQVCKLRPFGPLLRGKRIKKGAQHTLDEIKTCPACERGDTDEQRIANEIVDDPIAAAGLRTLVRRLRAENPWAGNRPRKRAKAVGF